MNRFLNLSLAMLLFCVSDAPAAVISRDWKTPGDGLLTYDDVNQREWLDLSQTLLSDQFPGSGSSALEIREARYQYVVGQTAAGGPFDGFSVAKSSDIIALAQSAGINTATLHYSTNSPATLLLSELVGVTIQPPNGNKFSVGLLDELGGLTYPHRLAAIFQLVFTSQAGLTIHDPAQNLQTLIPPGVMLFRAVPEPSAIDVSCLIYMFCCLNRRSRFRI